MTKQQSISEASSNTKSDVAQILARKCVAQLTAKSCVRSNFVQLDPQPNGTFTLKYSHDATFRAPQKFFRTNTRWSTVQTLQWFIAILIWPLVWYTQTSVIFGLRLCLSTFSDTDSLPLKYLVFCTSQKNTWSTADQYRILMWTSNNCRSPTICNSVVNLSLLHFKMRCCPETSTDVSTPKRQNCIYHLFTSLWTQLRVVCASAYELQKRCTKRPSRLHPASSCTSSMLQVTTVEEQHVSAQAMTWRKTRVQKQHHKGSERGKQDHGVWPNRQILTSESLALTTDCWSTRERQVTRTIFSPRSTCCLSSSLLPGAVGGHMVFRGLLYIWTAASFDHFERVHLFCDKEPTSGVDFLKSRLRSTSFFLLASLSSWRPASSVAVLSSSFCNTNEDKSVSSRHPK